MNVRPAYLLQITDKSRAELNDMSFLNVYEWKCLEEIMVVNVITSKMSFSNAEGYSLSSIE